MAVVWPRTRGMAVAATVTPPTPPEEPPGGYADLGDGNYDAIFSGDDTGATDVTSALRTFLENNKSNKTVALHKEGTYLITPNSSDADSAIFLVDGAVNFRIDFRGSKVINSKKNSLRTGTDLTATNGSGTVTSATANFSGSDVERVIGIQGVEYTIQAVTNATTATILASADFGSRYSGTTGTNKSWAIRNHAVHGIFRYVSANNVTINDLWVEGWNGPSGPNGFQWVDPDQYEHGVQIQGGIAVINRPKTRYMGGDGVYVVPNTSYPNTTNVEIHDPDCQYSGRNNISIIGGTVLVEGGSVDWSGLHGIDIEPNGENISGTVDATSIHATIDGVDVRGWAALEVENGEAAIAAGGTNGSMKPSVTVRNCTGKLLAIYIRRTTTVVVQNNSSENAAQYYYGTYPNANLNTSETITGNTNITIHFEADWAPNFNISQTR